MKIEKIIKAYEFAKRAHGNQKRRTGESYITHPVAVADLVDIFTKSDEIIVASFLHDVVEDTPISLEEIEKEFGRKVAFLVDGVTKLSTPEETFEKVAKYSRENTGVILIKLADRIHNTETIYPEIIEKYLFWNPQYAELGTQRGYDYVADILVKATRNLGGK